MEELLPGTYCVVIETFVPSSFNELELFEGDIVVLEEPDETDEQIPRGYLKVGYCLQA